MSDSPPFDPYALLGVDPDADEIVIQLAYRARIRQVHPDVAGADGLETTKRLNIARDWLLDPALRARPTAPRATRAEAHTGTNEHPWPGPRAGHERPSPGRDPLDLDPHTTDFGPHTQELRAFLHAIGSLSTDERARVNYSLGDARPPDLERYADYLGPQLWLRVRALRRAVERAWARGLDEAAPDVPWLGRILPSGFLVANAYAQWLLLQDFFRETLAGTVIRGEHVLDSLARRCVEPWHGSLGQPRYGPLQQDVLAFFATATALPVGAAERLARSWRDQLGRDGRGHPAEHIGPGVWLPAPPDYPDVLKISGYLAAVDASRLEPPAGLAARHHASYTFGLRITAHVLALGLMSDRTRDYLGPWREAVGGEPSRWGPLKRRARAG